MKKRTRISPQSKHKKRNLRKLRKYAQTKETADKESCAEEGIGAKYVAFSEVGNHTEGVCCRVKW